LSREQRLLLSASSPFRGNSPQSDTKEGQDSTPHSNPKPAKHDLNIKSLVERLWFVFTWYTVYHFPREPNHMAESTVLPFLVDCGFLKTEPGHSWHSGHKVELLKECAPLTKPRAEMLLRMCSQLIDVNIMFGDFLTLISCLGEPCQTGLVACSRCSANGLHPLPDIGVLLARAISEGLVGVRKEDADRVHRFNTFARRYVLGSAKERQPLPSTALIGRQVAPGVSVAAAIVNDLGNKEIFEALEAVYTLFAIDEEDDKGIAIGSYHEEGRHMAWEGFRELSLFFGLGHLSHRNLAEAFLSSAARSVDVDYADSTRHLLGNTSPEDQQRFRQRLCMNVTISKEGFVEVLVRLSVVLAVRCGWLQKHRHDSNFHAKPEALRAAAKSMVDLPLSTRLETIFMTIHSNLGTACRTRRRGKTAEEEDLQQAVSLLDRQLSGIN